jgi:hypothetical protein
MVAVASVVSTTAPDGLVITVVIAPSACVVTVSV